MFTTVFGFKLFSLGYIYLFILACAHTRVHRPLPRHREDNLQESIPSFHRVHPGIRTHVAPLYPEMSHQPSFCLWGVGDWTQALMPVWQALFDYALSPARQECFLGMALPSPGVLEQQTLVPSHPLHRAGEGFFSQSPFHGLVLCPDR